jgi:general secretion pathway protein F
VRCDLKAFRYPDGVTLLTIDALDVAAARRQVETQGYTVLSIREASMTSGSRWFAGGRFSTALFGQELLSLLDAGLSLVEALAMLSRKATAAEVRHPLAELHRLVGEGRSFSGALENLPTHFSALFVATVRTSERTGNLAEALRRYLTYHRQLNALRDKIIAATVYPALLIAVGMLVVLFLLSYVVPRFSHIYQDVGQARLPQLSRWLMQWGQAVGEHLLLFGLGFISVMAGFVYAVTRPTLRGIVVRRLWRLPKIGEQLRIYQLARFTRTVAMLLRGGVPLVAALEMTADLLRQPALKAGLASAQQSIRSGHSASEAFEQNGLATEIGVRLLVVGERSGDLGGAMERIASFYDDEIARSVEWATRLFEPLLMVFIGLVIGGIVILMYMPIFELAGSIQ